MADNLQTAPVDYNPFGATAAPGGARQPAAPSAPKAPERSPALNAEPVSYNPFGAITPQVAPSSASDPSQFMQGLKSGGINLISLGASAAAAGAQAYGSDEWEKKLDAIGDALRTEARSTPGKTQRSNRS